MDLPEPVQDALGDEHVAARVDLGGGDLLLVTSTRNLVYRDDGLLTEESVTEFPHGAERIEIDEGRRSSTIHLDYGLDGERSMGLPTDRLADAVHPILAGVLKSMGVTEPGETVRRTFRFSELTVVVTSRRLVRHVGPETWTEEFEEYHFDDVTDLRFEEGSHGTGVVVGLGERRERFKAPNDSARALRECLVDAVLSYHEYDDLDAFRADRAVSPEAADESGSVGFEGGPAPLGAGVEGAGTGDAGGGDDEAEPASAAETAETTETTETEPRVEIDTVGGATDDATAADETGASDGGGGSEAGVADGADEADDVRAELAALREAVERQGDRLDRQEELLEQLIDELRRGR